MKHLPKPMKSRDPVTILKRVIKLIQAEPKRYDQSQIIVCNGENVDSFYEDDYFPSCGTTACVAGWVHILTGGTLNNKGPASNVILRAERILKLTPDEGSDLFQSTPALDTKQRLDSWRRFNATPRQHAAAGVRHIKAFVKQKWGVKI